MNSSYLSYNQNDFFWVSVKDNFDFKVCSQLNEPTKKPKPLLKKFSNNPETDTSCNCPSQAPSSISTSTATPSPVPFNINTTAPVLLGVDTSKIDDFTKEICNNYNKSNTLVNLQNETSANQRNYNDTNDQYSKKFRKVVNVSIGIVAIVICIGLS